MALMTSVFTILLAVLASAPDRCCAIDNWQYFISSLTDNMITFSTNKQNVVAELALIHRFISRAYANCVSGTSPDKTPAINDQVWVLQKPCGKIYAKYNSDKPNKFGRMTTQWVVGTNLALFFNVTFVHFSLLPSLHDCDTEHLTFYYNGLNRIALCGTLFPSSYYILYHTGVMVFVKLPKTKSSFLAQYQVFSIQTRPLTTEIMIISEDGSGVSAGMFTPHTLSNQECMTCLHTVIYLKALFIIQYSVRIIAPMELACFDVNTYDGPSILLQICLFVTSINSFPDNC